MQIKHLQKTSFLQKRACPFWSTLYYFVKTVRIIFIRLNAILLYFYNKIAFFRLWKRFHYTFILSSRKLFVKDFLKIYLKKCPNNLRLPAVNKPGGGDLKLSETISSVSSCSLSGELVPAKTVAHTKHSTLKANIIAVKTVSFGLRRHKSILPYKR